MYKKLLLIFLLICGFFVFADNVDELVQAIKANNITQVKTIVENGIDVNKFSSEEYSPLYYAIEYSRLEIAQYLLAHGADPNWDYTVTLGPGQSVPPIKLALDNENEEMVDLLLEYGAYQSVVQDYYNNKMYSAIARGEYVLAEQLILSGQASLSDNLLTTLFEYESGNILQRLFIEKHGPEGIKDGTLNLLDQLIQSNKVYDEYNLPFPMATSFLRDENEYFRYSDSGAFDDSLSTSWVEGVSGPGIGQKITFEISPDAVLIEIVPGYGEERYFTSNNRIKKAELSFYRVEECASMIPSDNWVRIEPMDYTVELDFEDELSFQDFQLDIPISETKDQYGYEMDIIAVLEILEVYPGSQWDDTCIAEIRILE